MSAPPASDDVVATHAAAATPTRASRCSSSSRCAEFLAEHGLVADGARRAAPPSRSARGTPTSRSCCAAAGRELVLRRPPRGPLPPSAHDVLREARLLRALEPTAARVPRVLAVGDDPALIGAPFYVMERVAGDVVTSTRPARARHPAGAPADRRAARRRARRGPRGRLARVRPGGLLDPARRATSSASCGASAACGSTTARGRSRRSSASRRGSPSTSRPRRRRRSCTATTGWATSCSRPRAPARRRGGVRLGDGDDRRPARRRRLPQRDVGRSTTTRRWACSSCRA